MRRANTDSDMTVEIPRMTAYVATLEGVARKFGDEVLAHLGRWDLGWELREYHGRAGYTGPAVYVDVCELQDVIRATTMMLTWDSLGKTGLVVYPR